MVYRVYIPPRDVKIDVVPIPKSVNHVEPKDYRPISVLPAISKIFEKILLDQISSFLDYHQLHCRDTHNSPICYGFLMQYHFNQHDISIINGKRILQKNSVPVYSHVTQLSELKENKKAHSNIFSQQTLDDGSISHRKPFLTLSNNVKNLQKIAQPKTTLHATQPPGRNQIEDITDDSTGNPTFGYDDEEIEEAGKLQSPVSSVGDIDPNASCKDSTSLYRQCVEQQCVIEQLRLSLQEKDNNIKMLKRKYDDLDHQYQQHPAEKITRKMFNEDQCKLLAGDVRVPKWSDDSIAKGLRARLHMSRSAYEMERKKLKLPSARTLNEKIQHLHFEPGILNEEFELMSTKIPFMEKDDLDCALVFDEMAIAQGKDYCLNNKHYFGDITLPNHSGAATHVLMLMLVGIRRRWKQIVAYHYTGSSIANGCLRDIIVDTIKRSETLGLRVHAAISDCGSNNKRLWNDLHIQYSEHQVLFNRPIIHPCDKSRTLEVIPDCVHVFKNCVQGSLKNQIIVLPLDTIKQYSLCSTTANMMHIRDLVLYEASSGLKMATGLTTSDVDFSRLQNNFDKMKVPYTV
ncbi:uncharacterized protein LOC131680055 [Topomyia yanbarensis]|uniref:uncharacterized protein LOC131680055 n=1 Tax=Topomyia yanbarensis TaxID=2498891 RepID=UPI00273C0040|nr:uncharacterized protein LOC131680055 [Topomyia yanbarensis]